MVANDNAAPADARQEIARASDTDLLAFWAATETIRTTPEPDDEPADPHESALIEFAAQEMARRGLRPVQA
jgi:hypothetical protein